MSPQVRLNYIKTGATRFTPFYIVEIREVVDRSDTYDGLYTCVTPHKYLGHAVYERNYDRPYAGDRKVCEFPVDMHFEDVQLMANMLNKQYRIEMMLDVNEE